MQVVYDVLIKYADEDFYYVVSILDEFLIPVEYQNQNETEKIEKELKHWFLYFDVSMPSRQLADWALSIKA